MAFSAHKDPLQIQEHEINDHEVQKLAVQVAQEIRNGRHLIAFTGAGVSTSAGIPDFRGPQGVWTLQAQGKTRTAPTVSTLCAHPTLTHMALVGLEQAGILKCLISQNCDGLHRRSGFPPDKLVELHGNSNLERCANCKLEFMRDFHVRRGQNSVHEHGTERKCPACGQQLMDTIINFGENLPSEALHKGFLEGKHADICLTLGSSLTVTPAADIPRLLGEHGRCLVICNLQKTPLDAFCRHRVYAKTDIFMTHLMNALNVPIPEWHLQRQICLERCQINAEGDMKVRAFGVDHNGQMASIVRQVIVKTNQKNTNDVTSKTEPHEFILSQLILQSGTMEFHFYGHYQEPSLSLALVEFISGDKMRVVISISFQPGKKHWNLDKLNH